MKEGRDVIETRERRVWELRMQFKTHQQIADELKLTRPAVTQILKRINARHRARHEAEVDAFKSEHVEQLSAIAEQAYGRWAAATAHLSEKSLGRDAQYLAEVRGALADIRQIMGVNAPAKVAQTDPSGENEYGSERPALSDRERAERIAQLLDSARTRRVRPASQPVTNVDTAQ